MGRRKAFTTAGAVVKKPKAQVRKNKSSGSNFENRMLQFFTEYLRENKIKGVVYKFPDGRNVNQPLDLFIDSKSLGYTCVECKSLFEDNLSNEKIYFSKLGHVSNETGLHQFSKQHTFLVAGSRYGIMAFEFKNMKTIILVPHQHVYQILMSGQLYLTVSDLLKHGYFINDTKGSLVQFIKNKCKVYDRD